MLVFFPVLNVLKEASHPENCDWAKRELAAVQAAINNRLRNMFFMGAKKYKMFVLQNFIKQALYESRYRRSFWRTYWVLKGQFTIFQKKLSEHKNDNVQKNS